MSQRTNHRRGEGRHQDNGPRWENGDPTAGCNSTHVARARRAWRKLGRRVERRTGRKSRSVEYGVTGSQRTPEVNYEEHTGQ